MKKKCFAFLLFLFVVINFQACIHSPSSVSGEKEYVLCVGISLGKSIRNYLDIRDDYAFRVSQADIDDLKNRLFVVSESEMLWEKAECEVVSVFEAKDYDARRVEEPEKLCGVFSLAYSFRTKTCFLIQDGRCCQLRETEGLREKVSEILSRNNRNRNVLVATCVDGTFERKLIRDNPHKVFYDNWILRTGFYWLQRNETVDDAALFHELNGYSAETYEEMIDNSNAALGLDEYVVMVAFDSYSGRYLLEYYPYYAPNSTERMEPFCYICFDENYRVLFGWHG